jgi:hypothetical protein
VGPEWWGAWWSMDPAVPRGAGPGVAQEVGSPVDWSSGSAGLWGGDLVVLLVDGDVENLGAQSAKVLALPCALPQLSVSPVSQQGP